MTASGSRCPWVGSSSTPSTAPPATTPPERRTTPKTERCTRSCTITSGNNFCRRVKSFLLILLILRFLLVSPLFRAPSDEFLESIAGYRFCLYYVSIYE